MHMANKGGKVLPLVRSRSTTSENRKSVELTRIDNHPINAIKGNYSIMDDGGGFCYFFCSIINRVWGKTRSDAIDRRIAKSR